MENDSEKRIKVFRIEKRGEFCSNEFKNYCVDAGIVRHYTAPYTPQQNGVLDRRNRTVVVMARSFIKGIKMSSNF